jgi:pyrroline-5-carboxylate reductase
MGAWPERVGVIGAGAMGRALAAGLVRGNAGLAAGLRFADALPAAAERALAEVGGTAATVEDAAGSDLVCLAVKPKDVEAALRQAQPALAPQAVLLSVVMGCSLDRLAHLAPGVPLVRTMPNLAVRHGAGVVAVASRGLDGSRQARVMELLRGLGSVVPLPEELFPAATAVIGSAPGFVALVAEGLEEGAVSVGLARAEAREMVRAALAGTAALLADGGDPAALRQGVTSPAGSTAAGIAALERGAVRAHLADAVRAAAATAADASHPAR